ncbi:MAG: alpha-amylase [Propionibacteriaceae bacterium]|nr:alpha-amylase [Propionibacteriaceae bacterium]
MSWADSVIWWHVYPLGFVGAERTAVPNLQHRLPQLENWLDYLIGLGANGLLLAPLFASASHGYDTLDHYRIDTRLGDGADFDHLVRECGERGIRVCLDGVFNHLARNHPVVQAALDGGPDSAAGRWIRWVDGYPRYFEGHDRLVELDLTHPPVADYVTGVMTHWLGRGIDGWRLDAAYAQGSQVWAPILARVKAEYPDSWVVAEVIHGDYAEFVSSSGVDSVTQYELWHAIWDSLNDRNFFSLDWTLARHREFCERFRPQTFIGNHDVTRIASKLNDPRHVRLAAALLFLLPGIPSIYAGDEQGFTGVKEENHYGDDAVRPPFPAQPSELLPFGEATHADYTELIGIRRRHPWLVEAVATTSEVTNTFIAIRLEGNGQALTLRLNTGDQPVTGVAPHDWTVS